jgi:hypothetical protein
LIDAERLVDPGAAAGILIDQGGIEPLSAGDKRVVAG